MIVKTQATLAHSIQPYQLNFGSCDPLAPKTLADISYAVRLADGSAAPAWFNFASGTGAFNFSPVDVLSNDVIYNIVVRATLDGSLYDEEKTFSLTVKPTNFAPDLATKPAASL